jgi:glutamine---fructose-6-phosphate transaminase (isomerizing)
MPAMEAEMGEQPAVLARLLERRPTIAARFGEALPSPLLGVALVGRGSSGAAAAFGRYLLEPVAGRPAFTVPPGVAVAAERPSYNGFVAVGISQSGETPEVAALGRAGAVTVAVTAAPGSRLAAGADVVVDLATGTEEAVPATKTFTATLAALLFLAEAIGRVGWSERDLAGLPAAVTAVLDDTGPPGAVAQRLGGLDGWACVGRGLLRPIAEEAALKLEEAALVVADHHSSASFRHGPIATAGPTRPVLAFASPPLAAGDDSLALSEDLRRRGSPVVVIGTGAGADLPVPALPGPLLAIPAAVRAQQLAVALARHRHLDPSRPPGLTKVTRT